MIGGHDSHLLLIQKLIFNTRMLSSELVKSLNIKHSKGILLYGPPGTGKTAIARQMANFSTLPVTIINGPSILDKYVGEP
jgi:vesicle-fusing ATPase